MYRYDVFKIAYIFAEIEKYTSTKKINTHLTRAIEVLNTSGSGFATCSGKYKSVTARSTLCKSLDVQLIGFD